MNTDYDACGADVSITDVAFDILDAFAARCIRDCAAKFGFDPTSEIERVRQKHIDAKLIRKMHKMHKLPEDLKDNKDKDTKDKPEQKLDINIHHEENDAEPGKKHKKKNPPLPFIPELVNEEACQAIVYNHGLFTQCDKSTIDDSRFCKQCHKLADMHDGIPPCGTVDMRRDAMIYQYKDSQGRSPIHYLKVLNKLHYSIDDVLPLLPAETPQEHLTHEPAPIKKGRPKKSVQMVATHAHQDENDTRAIFEQLNEHQDNQDNKDKDNKDKDKDKDKEDKKLILQQQRDAKKAEKEAEKIRKEAEKLAEKQRKEAEKQAEKLRKEAEKLAEKQRKEAEKTEKAEKQRKEAEISQNLPGKNVPGTNVPDKNATDKKHKAVKININHIDYWHTPHNHELFDLHSYEFVGTFQPSTNTILPPIDDNDYDNDNDDDDDDDQDTQQLDDQEQELECEDDDDDL
jgi:chemotaxis protein histidine kinase CheA